MSALAYRKNKNTGHLFKDLEVHVGVHLAQNYVPLYTRFFTLNSTNWNNVTLDHPVELLSVNGEDAGRYACTVRDANGLREIIAFFKLCPLVDPSKYLTGVYANQDLTLPSFEGDVHPKLAEKNNSAYVDSFFYYLTSRLRRAGFVHGLEFYGSFLGEKHGFQYNLEDDASFCLNCSYFEKHNHTLFTVNKTPISREKLEFGDDLELEVEEVHEDDDDYVHATCDDAKDVASEEVQIPLPTDSLRLRARSMCSSKSSNTDGEEVEEESDYADDLSDDARSNASSGYDDPVATIAIFPVQLVAMEACTGTLDSLLRHLTAPELTAALMQVIMTLVAYNRIFQFTHNDLHTNNIMYVPTDEPYLYYQYKDTSYRVPTYGRIFKLIDFGRSIYSYCDRRFVSDSFSSDGDAASQYNIEPFLNPNKEVLEANYSFDLCRLACSMLDMLPEAPEFEPLAQLIDEWCQDDKKRNVVYKQNGDERYPCFKLYKMIARTVHAHTAEAQLRRALFQQFIVKKKSLKDHVVMQLDTLCA